MLDAAKVERDWFDIFHKDVHEMLKKRWTG